MLILTFEEFNNKFNIDNNAMSDIRIKDIGKDKSPTPIGIVIRDETPDSIREPNFNIIVNLHPTEGTHWVLVIGREGGPVYYVASFGVETPPLFLEEYVDLGSNERIQQYDESYCGAYCLYMIYLIDRGFRIKSALYILVNHVKCPEIYNECFCLGCNVNVNDNANDNVHDKDNDNDNDNDIDNDNDLRSSFTNNDKDNDIDNDNDLRSSFTTKDNVNENDLRDSFANNVNDNDNNDVSDNVNDNDNDNVNDNVIYQLAEKLGETSVKPVPGWTKSYGEASVEPLHGWIKSHQKGKPNNKECPTNTISININDDLQSWLNDDDIITEATFQITLDV